MLARALVWQERRAAGPDAAAAAVPQRDVPARGADRVLRLARPVRRPRSCCRSISSSCSASTPRPRALLVMPFLTANVVGAVCRRAASRGGSGARKDDRHDGPAARARRASRCSACSLRACPGSRAVLASARRCGDGRGRCRACWSQVQNAAERRDVGAAPGRCCSCAPWAARSAARSSAPC